ncbi:DUF2746 domain-containing protein [Curtobacterium sp. MCBA15_004]|uniref:DUF2746 domain-containing protein n=1 Tax=Curtobacterium sp. MCBA15_004 TaxID=1898733 RepID=UPI0008DD37FA|nr:DUF2746 domain-containing protein [Curtobacterium sp. MCBA15_004]WIA98024.1 DUF2746 domain-containing protein [Curtobacterium sp. MCBA15_004]
MIVAADTWADFAGDVWGDPTARWIVYAALVVAVGIGMWRGFRRIRAFLIEFRADLGVVKHEVKNNHTTNLREEADVRHDENTSALRRIEKKVDEALVKLGVHEYRINELDAEVENTRERNAHG